MNDYYVGCEPNLTAEQLTTLFSIGTSNLTITGCLTPPAGLVGIVYQLESDMVGSKDFDEIVSCVRKGYEIKVPMLVNRRRRPIKGLSMGSMNNFCYITWGLVLGYEPKNLEIACHYFEHTYDYEPLVEVYFTVATNDPDALSYIRTKIPDGWEAIEHGEMAIIRTDRPSSADKFTLSTAKNLNRYLKLKVNSECILQPHINTFDSNVPFVGTRKEYRHLIRKEIFTSVFSS